ncbi:MAG: xylulose kinase, partial [Caldilinea sp.]
LAGIGAGVYHDVADAVQSVRYTTTVIEPEPAAAEFYERGFQQVYCALYPAVRDLHHAIVGLGD